MMSVVRIQAKGEGGLWREAGLVGSPIGAATSGKMLHRQRFRARYSLIGLRDRVRAAAASWQSRMTDPSASSRGSIPLRERRPPSSTCRSRATTRWPSS
jgi:hypothetical protein